MNASTQPAGFAPVPLLDRWTRHLTFAGREPRTLEKLAVAHADYQCRQRLSEIKAMRKKLALLDAFVPALAHAGIRLADRRILTYDGGKSLRIEQPLLSHDNKLMAALLELGFRETGRRVFAHDVDVMLQHGRSLRVSISIRADKGGAA